METTVCTDHLGNKHIVPTSALVKRRSAYGIVIHENKVLLVHEIHTDRWEFPGGGIEPGEDIVAGLKREVFEETGMQFTGEATHIHDVHEYYFNLSSSEGWDSTRSFYLLRGNVAGDLLKTGNNDDTLGTEFVFLDEAKNRFDKQLFVDLLAEAVSSNSD